MKDSADSKPSLLDQQSLNRNADDVAYFAARFGLSFVPQLQVAYEESLPHPALRRQLDMLRAIVERVNYLLTTGVTYQDLEGNETFVAAVYQAHRMLLEAHHKEKKDFILNALENVGRLNAQADLVTIAMSYLERLTPSHIAVLKHLRTLPEPQYGDHTMEALRRQFPELHELGVLGHVLEELYNCGLIAYADSLGTTVTTFDNPTPSKALTGLGEVFLRFLYEKMGE